MSAELETYLAQLERELRKRGLVDARVLEEARGHLTDAADEGVRRGLTPDEAVHVAVARFGTPQGVARKFAAERYRLRDRLLLAAAVAMGIAIAYVDSRPGWDDAGITAGSLLIAAGVVALIGPQRPWLWALAVGIWIPLHALTRTGSPAAMAMFVLLAFPAVGAYSGMALRRALLAASGPQEHTFKLIRQRDRRSRFALHTLVKAKGHRALPLASEPEIRSQIVPFLERVTRDSNPLGVSGAIQSLTLLDDAVCAGRHVRTYRALFDNGAAVTVVHTSDERSVSIDASPG